MTTERKKLIAHYQNGNYSVSLFADGTKVKQTQDDFFVADFPDSVDLKITDFCDMHCPMCHENSSESGVHGDLDAPFTDTFRPGTELAIGGGNPLSHPGLVPFLERMKERGVICNLTVNEAHLIRERGYVEKLLGEKLVWGLGISPRGFSPEIVEFARTHGTAVLHLICGMVAESELTKLYDRGLNILLLGYKRVGRGKSNYSESIERGVQWLRKNIVALSSRFRTVCFDNLAIEQLGIRDLAVPEAFDEMYMGDDGSASMYIDAVKKQFAVSSVSSERYGLLPIVDEMFARVKKLASGS